MENAEKPGVLIVDDDEALLTQLRWSLGDEYRINVAKERIAAMAALRETPAASMRGHSVFWTKATNFGSSASAGVPRKGASTRSDANIRRFM